VAVAAAEDRQLDELVEDDPAGMRRAVAAQRVVDLPGGQQRADLDRARPPFDAANTYHAPDGQRRCRTCLREAQGGGSDVA
jgi:hypothetical protein